MLILCLNRSALHLKNQNLINLLSKVSLITTSIEDHINRRFNRILSNNNLMVPALKSLKNSASSSAESGLTASETNDADSNDDLSDDGLDYSQKFCDNLTSNELTDDAIIGNVLLTWTPDYFYRQFNPFIRIQKRTSNFRRPSTKYSTNSRRYRVNCPSRKINTSPNWTKINAYSASTRPN